MSDEIGTTRFKPHDLILCCKVFDSFSHGSGPTEAFFSDQIGCETSDVGSCCAHIRVSKAWEMSGGGADTRRYRSGYGICSDLCHRERQSKHL